MVNIYIESSVKGPKKQPEWSDLYWKRRVTRTKR